MDNVKKSLPNSWWDMVNKYYPNYYRSDDVLRNDILERYLDDEMSEEECEAEFGRVNPDRITIIDEYNGSCEYLFQRSLVEFAKECRAMSRKDFYEMIEEPMPMDENISYFLLGEEACALLMDNDFDEAVSIIEEENVVYDLFIYDAEVHSIIDLISQLRGWNDYCIIDKLQYDRLSEI